MRGKSICAASVGDGRLPFRSLLAPSWVFLSREGVLQEFLMQMEMHACIARLSLLVSCSGLDESVPRWCLLSDYICRPRWSMAWTSSSYHRSTGSNRVTSAEEKAYLMEWSGRILRSLYSAHRCIHCSCDGDDGARATRPHMESACVHASGDMHHARTWGLCACMQAATGNTPAH